MLGFLGGRLVCFACVSGFAFGVDAFAGFFDTGFVCFVVMILLLIENYPPTRGGC
jgi:hypothetical protein